MAIVSTRQAQQLGRSGGKISAVDRKGDSAWGRRAQQQRAARAQKQHYPELSKAWARNANRVRRGKHLEPVPLVMTSAAIIARETWQLRQRREGHERERQREP